MITCGKREFQTWEEASVFIEEFKQMEKERKEKAFYCWHNIPIEGIICLSVSMGVNMAINLFDKMNIEDEAIKEMIIDVSTEKIFNDVIENIDVSLSRELHTGHRLPLISFDSPQEEKEEVTVN